MLERAIDPFGALPPPYVALKYLLVVPGTYPFVLIIRRVAGLRVNQTSNGISVATAAALLIDGVAFAWFPDLYSENPLPWATSILCRGGRGVGARPR